MCAKVLMTMATYQRVRSYSCFFIYEVTTIIVDLMLFENCLLLVDILTYLRN